MAAGEPTRAGELPVIWDVVDVHLEEAGMLWAAWEQALLAPDLTLAELATTDEERLLAHAEGLVAGGAAVVRERLLPTLADEDDPELVFAAALALLWGGYGGQAVPQVMEALVEADDEAAWALSRALQLAPLADDGAGLVDCLTDETAAVRAAALRALSLRRADLSGTLPALLGDDAAEVRMAALTAARGKAGAAVMPRLARALEDPDARVQEAALEAGIVHGLEPARRRCRDLAGEAGQHHALLLLALHAHPDALRPLQAALVREEDREAALLALGFLGTPGAVANALPHLEGSGCEARLAGEAVAAMAGLDLVAQEMVLTRPEDEPDEPVPLEDEDLDAELVPTPVDLLPLPDAPAVVSWWEQNHERFSDIQRYVSGMPASTDAYRVALLRSPMRRRHTLALDLAIRTGGQQFPETRTWAADQLRALRE